MANGLNRCGFVLNVLVGHVFHSFSLLLSLGISWYVDLSMDHALIGDDL